MNNRLISIVCGVALILAKSGWFLATAGVLVIAACPATAADFGMLMRAPPIPPPPPLYNWTGFYIGGNGGAGWTHDTFTVTSSDGAAGSGRADGNGWFAGGQIGFNWQFATHWVIGVEADADWSDVNGSSESHCSISATGPSAGSTSGCSNASFQQDDFGTVRGRFGYAINNVLLYGTGGWAWSRSTTNNMITCVGGGCPVATLVSGFVLSSASATANPSGWVAGGGIEWGFAPNWTVRVEYLHLQFEDVGQDFAFTSATGATAFAHSQANSSEDTIRLGINYLFNWGAPLIFAADMPVKAQPPALLPTVWEWSGFYIGVGGSFNWSQFDQSLQGVSGIIDVVNLQTGQLFAQGQEGGPFFDFNRNKSGFAPDVQLGYMVPFAGGGWLAGLKFTYKYANNDSKENVNIPQDGTGTLFTTVPPTTKPITGFVLISPAEINLKHQFALTPTIGHTFGNVVLYVGGGPALFDVKTNFFNGIPFAETPEELLFPANAVPLTELNDNWVWGGAAQVGATYAFARNWFLDVNYTYARSANFTIEDPLFVKNQVGALMLSGPAVLNTEERVTNQSVMVAINYQFH